MKTYLTPKLVALAVFATVCSLASSSGPSSRGFYYTGADRSNGGSEATCTVCHNGGNFGEPIITVSWSDGTTDGPLTEYMPGRTYTVTVRVTSPTPAAAYGFQGTIVSPSTLEGIGTMAETTGNTGVSLPNAGRTYVEHLEPVESGTFSFDWTAPAAGAGPAEFYLSGNAVNLGRSTADDNGSTAPTIISLAEGGALPIDLVDFSGTVDKNLARLTWSAERAEDFSHFAIERRASEGSFRTVGFLPAAADHHASRTYEYSDAAPLTGPTTYRLRMVDLDGSVAYGPLLNLSPTATAPLSVYPNPVASLLNVTTPADRSGGTILVRDVSGRVLLESDRTAQIDVGTLSPGVYTVEYRDAAGTRAAKFIKR